MGTCMVTRKATRPRPMQQLALRHGADSEKGQCRNQRPCNWELGIVGGTAERVDDGMSPAGGYVKIILSLFYIFRL